MKTCILVLALVAVLGLTKGGVIGHGKVAATLGLTDPWSEDVPLEAPKDIWSDCGKEGDIGHIRKVVIQPDPPVEGKNVSVTVQASLDQNVTSGSVEVNIVYDKFIPITKKYDLCLLISDIGRHCPIPKGNFTVSLDTLDKGIPKGQYSGTAVAVDQDGNTVFCIRLDFKIP